MILTALLVTTTAMALPPRDVIAFVDPLKETLEASVVELQFSTRYSERVGAKIRDYSIPWTVKSEYSWSVTPSISPTSRIIFDLSSEYSLWFNAETGVSRTLPENFVYEIIWSSDGSSASGINSNGNVIVVDAEGDSLTLDVMATRVVAFKDRKIFAYNKKDGAKPVFFVCDLSLNNKVESISGSEWVNQMVGSRIANAEVAAQVLVNGGKFWQGVIVSDIRKSYEFPAGEELPQTFIFTPRGNFEVSRHRQLSGINILDNGNVAFEIYSWPPEKFHRKEQSEFLIFDWKKREGFAFQEWESGTYFPVGSSVSTRNAEKLPDSVWKEIIFPVK